MSADFSTWDRATLEQFAQEATDKLVANNDYAAKATAANIMQRERIAALEAELAELRPLYTSAPSIPEGWLKICADELQRTKLTSYPLKFAFAKEHGMSGLDEVHAWMKHAHRTFESMVLAAAPKHTKEAE